MIFCSGLGLFIKTSLLFHKLGQGTLSPLAPPNRLVIQWPYKIVRNPMILGIMFILLSEALLFSSKCIAIYTLIFFLINCIYFKTVEEKMLILSSLIPSLNSSKSRTHRYPYQSGLICSYSFFRLHKYVFQELLQLGQDGLAIHIQPILAGTA